jgi:UDPglucose 6-dehydrogenase
LKAQAILTIGAAASGNYLEADVVAAIVIVGSGVVGTATGKGFVQCGHDVTFVDVNSARLDELTEQGLRASATIDLSGSAPSFIFLTLPTPQNRRRYDLSYIEAGAVAVGRALATATVPHRVVVRSTVPPGTCEGLVARALRSSSGKELDAGFHLASNPEFLRAVAAEQDFLRPWMTVVGSRDPGTRAALRELLEPFGGAYEEFENPSECELIKCAHNLFNATKISFWNDMWRVGHELSLDVDRIADVVSRSAEGSFNRRYGIKGGAPYGGACLPKDTNGFWGFAASMGLDLPTLHGAILTNEAMERLLEWETESVMDLSESPSLLTPDAQQ